MLIPPLPTNLNAPHSQIFVSFITDKWIWILKNKASPPSEMPDALSRHAPPAYTSFRLERYYNNNYKRLLRFCALRNTTVYLLKKIASESRCQPRRATTPPRDRLSFDTKLISGDPSSIYHLNLPWFCRAHWIFNKRMSNALPPSESCPSVWRRLLLILSEIIIFLVNYSFTDVNQILSVFM